MFKRYLKISFVLLLASSTAMYAQNVGINTSGATPSKNAILDLSTGNLGQNLGLIVPNVTLAAALTDFGPLTGGPIIGNPTGQDVGMMVYNRVATNQPIGYYYWNGATWVSMGGGASSLAGGGTINYLARWTGATALGIGVMQDNGTGAGISSAAITPKSMLDVNGGVAVGAYAGSVAAPANGMIVSGQVGIGTNAPNASAAVDLTSASKGVLMPRLTAPQIAAIGTPAMGLIVYNTTTNCYEFNTTGTPAGWNVIACP
jgi:hypothetical protein